MTNVSPETIIIIDNVTCTQNITIIEPCNTQPCGVLPSVLVF